MKTLTLFFILVSLPLSASAKLKVVTTTADLAALAREVGGDRIEVQSLCRGDQDPHYIEPKPSFVLALNRADLLIPVGLELESGWLPVLLTQSRNPKIQPGLPGFLNASEEVHILEIPTGTIDRSMGDIHPEGNPHYWLNPKNGLLIAKRISERLSDLEPANAYFFAENFRQFERRLLEQIAGWEKALLPLKGTPVVTYHKSFSYFVDWAGLQVRGLIEPKPGIPPSPAHLLSLIQMIDREKIPLLITENYYDPKPSQEIAAKTGAKLLLLPTSVDGEKGIGTYQDLFRFLVARIGGAR